MGRHLVFLSQIQRLGFSRAYRTFEVGISLLFALSERMPEELKVTAISDDDVIMGIEHKTPPLAAVQFHPESIMSLTER